MAFSNTMLNRIKMGGSVIEIGTFTNDSTAGGEVGTSLSRVDGFIIQPTGAAVNANEASVNETFPLAGSAVTVVTDSDSETYLYFAFGAD